MADESRALEIPTPGGTLVPKWWADVYGPRTLFKTTLNLKDEAQRAVILRSINEDCDTARSVLNIPLDIMGYTISPASKVKDGEVNEWVRCVLHLADGRNVAAGSMGLLKSIMMIEQLHSPAPWNPPIVRVIKARDLGDGKVWYYLAEPTTGTAAKQKAGK